MMSRFDDSVYSALPTPVTPAHEQVAYVDNYGSGLRVYGSKPPTPLVLCTRLRLGRAGVGHLEATDIVLKEERQRAEIRVCGNAGRRSQRMKRPQKGGIMDQVEVEVRLSMRVHQGVVRWELQGQRETIQQLMDESRTILFQHQQGITILRPNRRPKVQMEGHAPERRILRRRETRAKRRLMATHWAARRPPSFRMRKPLLCTRGRESSRHPRRYNPAVVIDQGIEKPSSQSQPGRRSVCSTQPRYQLLGSVLDIAIPPTNRKHSSTLLWSIP